MERTNFKTEKIQIRYEYISDWTKLNFALFNRIYKLKTVINNLKSIAEKISKNDKHPHWYEMSGTKGPQLLSEWLTAMEKIYGKKQLRAWQYTFQ